MQGTALLEEFITLLGISQGLYFRRVGDTTDEIAFSKGETPIVVKSFYPVKENFIELNLLIGDLMLN